MKKHALQIMQIAFAGLLALVLATAAQAETWCIDQLAISPKCGFSTGVFDDKERSI